MNTTRTCALAILVAALLVIPQLPLASQDGSSLPTLQQLPSSTVDQNLARMRRAGPTQRDMAQIHEMLVKRGFTPGKSPEDLYGFDLQTVAGAVSGAAPGTQPPGNLPASDQLGGGGGGVAAGQQPAADMIVQTLQFQNYWPTPGNERSKGQRAAIGVLEIKRGSGAVDQYAFALISKSSAYTDAAGVEEYTVKGGRPPTRGRSWWSCVVGKLRAESPPSLDALTQCGDETTGWARVIQCLVESAPDPEQVKQILACCACGCHPKCRDANGCCR